MMNSAFPCDIQFRTPHRYRVVCFPCELVTFVAMPSSTYDQRAAELLN